MIFQYEPLIQESNIAHVHHMILYECRLSETERHYEKWVETKGAQCYTANMPVSWTACSTPIVAWAVGSDGKWRFTDQLILKLFKSTAITLIVF